MGGAPGFELQDIKTEPLTAEQLEQLHDLAGSYEALFSRRARKYRSLGLHEKALTEEDYRQYMLQEYTFLKRPVILIDDQVFIGKNKKNMEAVKNLLTRV